MRIGLFKISIILSLACGSVHAADGADSVSTESSSNSETKSFDAFAQVKVDRIDILGVTAFGVEAIQSIIEVSPGDLLQQRKVIRTEENLLSLYRSHGYEDASVSSRLVRKLGPNQEWENTI